MKWKKGSPLPLGASVCGEVLQFAVAAPGRERIRLNLYEPGRREKTASLHLDNKFQTGSIFSVQVEGIPPENLEYAYEADGAEFADPYGMVLAGREKWGKRSLKGSVRSRVYTDSYDWGNDKAPRIPLEDVILYQLHIRGFTKHRSSGVEHRGTFRGVEEKISYLKELGITSLLALPCYEFNEIMEDEMFSATESRFAKYRTEEARTEKPPVRLNYWGYGTDCSYFAPKSSYAADKENPGRELKDLIRQLHENDMEFIMEFQFASDANRNMILDCLRYWTLEYHVDGFKFNEEVVPANFAAADPLLGGVKLLAGAWDMNSMYREGYRAVQKNLAEYNGAFMAAARRFLKSDEQQVDAFLDAMKKNAPSCGVINFITSINGFTLMDLVSYDIKHNEANGEDGKDGTDYNYSWNCGVEGKTRRKAVQSLRRRQIKNAVLMLFLSQGTPMLLSGDEMGHTALGNNNPYCQDNEISWINWNKTSFGNEIFSFVKDAILLRSKHRILHKKEELRAMDLMSCGYPDISFHGTRAWYPDFSNYSRVLGVLLCGKYAKNRKKEEDDFFYFAYNMHWESHAFGLPKLPAGMEWRVCVDTSDAVVTKLLGEGEAEYKKEYVVPARSIVVFQSRKAEKPAKMLPGPAM